MISPIELKGPWDKGYAVDNYIIHSDYLGEDVFGKKQFHNIYTQIGNLLHAMKYNGHLDTSLKIAELCAPVVTSLLNKEEIDIILPVPATIQRDVQPVYLIAEALSEMLHINYSADVLLRKSGSVPIKGIPVNERSSQNSVFKEINAKRKCNILLIDDFYSSGVSASECVKVLREDKNIDKIFFLAVAKTKG